MVMSVRTFRYADEFSDELAISLRAMWTEKSGFRSGNGRRIKDFRHEWKRATGEAKLAGLSDHGLCRSCAGNLSRAGVPETVASKYMNRKTLSIYKLYRIVDTVDTELAGEAYQRYLDREANAAKIAELEDEHRQNSHIESTSKPQAIVNS